MERLSVLLKKADEIRKKEGIAAVCQRASDYIKRERNIKKYGLSPLYELKSSYIDVLFINGCYLPHPSRYRISHQREQLLAGNMTSGEIFYTDLDLELVSHFRVFIFFRCPYTEKIGKFIKLAKYYHKTVLFDIDDLVIDQKYTDSIPYVQNMSSKEKAAYDNGVKLIQKTLKLCEGAITTTERLAEELKGYVKEVYINRNVVSDRMQQLSEWAVYDRDILPYLDKKMVSDKANHKKAVKLTLARKKDGIRLGYFSGSITHNDDFALILPVLRNVMKRYKKLKLYLTGELDLPQELKPYQDRIVITPFIDWEELPKKIASVDINLAPLNVSIFNEAKSENKWTEAAFVKVPTIASCVGAFERVIEDGKTGILCHTKEEWEEKLCYLIENKKERERIGQAAYQYVNAHCNTVETGYHLTKYIKEKMKPNIIFVLPTAQISGGALVTLKHASLLLKSGMDVCIFNEGYEKCSFLENDRVKIPVIRKPAVKILGSIDKAVATLWSTMSFVMQYPNIKKRYYLVQNYETNFLQPGQFFRFQANQTYNACIPVQYITISRWCKRWLREKYGKEALYAPNGIDGKRFYPVKRKFEGKIRILIEGNSEDYYKNVDESFRITNQLDQNQYEIWYMSYQGKPKKWYHVDRFFHKIPNHKVADIYRQCHILLKSSILESFSYPPLEMMATGGFVVAAPNEGNVEYLKDGINCIFYKQGELENAKKAIEKICSKPQLRETLYQNGMETVQKRDWNQIKNSILLLYQ